MWLDSVGLGSLYHSTMISDVVDGQVSGLCQLVFARETASRTSAEELPDRCCWRWTTRRWN